MLFLKKTYNQRSFSAAKTGISTLVISFLSITILSAAPFFMQKTGSIIIDAGHGGDDPGAVAEFLIDDVMTIFYEKDINLAISNRVAAVIEQKFPEILLYKTRNDDSSISLWERAQYANSIETAAETSKIFVSIHANSAPGTEAYGFEIWKLYPHITHDFYSSDIQEFSLVRFVDQTNNALNKELDNAESLLAESVMESLSDGIGDKSRNRGIKESAFYVLKQTYMVSILIETGFISYQDELIRLIDPEYQNTIAASIVEGISLYMEKTGN